MLKDDDLINCYFAAVELNSDEDFLQILLEEIKRRHLDNNIRGIKPTNSHEI
uniref:sporulation histidine kinase inhibitor Sda n=1 Tax=Paenibacillus sp. FSL K6-0276 TaxID=2921450 RepID=UPI00403F5A4D